MAREDILHLVCLLLLVNNCVNYCSCAYHDHYVEYGLESEKFCHRLGKTSTIDIKSGAAIVRPKHMFDRWNVHSNVHCKFTFKAAKGDGIFGVIQKMSFRQNGTQCLDYVQFRRKDHHRTEKFCGFLDRSKYNLSSSETPLSVSTYAEYDPSSYKSAAELETEIFISKEPVQPGEPLVLSIAYTSFTNCSAVDSTKYMSIGYQTCILNEFFCDGIYNCAPTVCLDEDKCVNNSNEIVGSSTGTKVTIGAVTTLILCFIIFVMCLWICKRSQKVCWVVEYSNSNMCPRPGQLPHVPGRSANPPVPSAPMLEVAVSSSVADKDSPPSYDSLFPEQSNTTRS